VDRGRSGEVNPMKADALMHVVSVSQALAGFLVTQRKL
jgi:hypothetical protein